MIKVDQAVSSNRAGDRARANLRLASGYRFFVVPLILALLLSGFLPAIATAQDASTPAAERTEAITEPETTPTEIPPTEEVVESSPTPAPTTAPETEPTEAPTPNSDSIAPVVQPLVIQPGQMVELHLSYQITTDRLETGIHLELRTTANVPAENWVIESNGSGGFGGIDLANEQTDPGTLAITLRITAPEGAADGDTLILLASSIVRTTAGELEHGVAAETPIASLIVDAPEPTPATTASSTPPASPEASEPSATATVEETATTVPVDATPVPASPQPETPAATPSPEATIDLSSELTLVGRKPRDTVAIGESRSVTLNYAYTPGFARAGTTISAQMVNWDGKPEPGWSVQLNGSPETFHDSEHLDTGSTFDVEVVVMVDDTVKANAKARLLFTVTVDPATEANEPAEFTFAVAAVEAAPPEPELSETFEGPMLRLDGGFETASVSAPNNGLACFDPSATYPGGIAADSMIPGQIARFTCNLTLSGISLLPTFSGTATIQGANTAGWQIAASSQVSLIGASLLAPVGTYSTTSVSMSGLGVLSIAALLGAGGLSFSIYVKAPSLPLSLSPVNSVSITVNTHCEAVLGASNCLGSVFGSRDATATLSATVRDIQTTASGGGALTDAGLLGTIGGLIGNGLVFRLYCDTPATGTQVAPGEIVPIQCHIISLIDLTLLGSLASVTTDLTISFTDPSPNWKLSYNGTPVSGVINLPLTLVSAGILSASADFAITLQYDPGACISTPFTGQPLNSVNVTGEYHAKLASLVEIGLSDGWASVPIQLEGASSRVNGTPPVLSNANAVNFGTFTYNGATGQYTGGNTPTLAVTLSAPTTSCIDDYWRVSVAFTSLQGYQDSGHTQPKPGATLGVGTLSFTGGTSGDFTGITTSLAAPSTSPQQLLFSSDTLASPRSLTFTMALAPPGTQPTGYYQGTVTLTSYSGDAP